ncbi:MAG: hypothetical protein RSP_06950 [Rhodanobacter sp.]
MPRPPHSDTPPPRAQRPAQVLLNSPLAASARMLGLRASRRPRPRLVWRRTLALAASMLIHLFFLFGFILGPAWEPPQGKDVPAKMQARFIELPDLAPPPPPKGEPPRQEGPVHQGHAAVTARAAHTAAQRAPRMPAVAAKAVAAAPAKAVAAPTPPPSVPKPAPAPRLQPVPVAMVPPPVSPAAPTLQPPVPPKFQPEPVRAPQLEGNRPMLPPPSLALPTVPPQSPPTIAPPTVALDRVAADVQAPAIVQPVHVDLPAAPTAPELQAVPLAAQAAPQVSLQSTLNAPSPSAPQSLPKVLAPAPAEVQEKPLAAVPQSAPAAPRVAAPAKAAIKIADDASLSTIGQPSAVTLPSVESAPATTAVTAASASNGPAGTASEGAAADVSTSPHANPQGSDSARPGEPQGVSQAADAATVHGAGPLHSHGLGQATAGETGKGLGKAPGASAGASSAGQAVNEVPEFIQLKPTGDTAVMSHDIHGVKYQSTRFDPYWTPPGESSVDTALRHAAEKTTLQHTFHLPRGIRIKCVVMPLIPVSLLGCGNADAPPPAMPQKSYDRLNLPEVSGGSVPSLPPAPAATAATPARIVLDNAALCAAARVAGSPLPRGCPPVEPVVRGHAPAASSSSWVPASDQFGAPAPVRAGQP